jgi:hypothetical protein
MFDYDARPVTPQVVIVGRRASSVGYQLRDFLSRNLVGEGWLGMVSVPSPSAGSCLPCWGLPSWEGQPRCGA